MTTDIFPFYGTIQQCWDVCFTEYQRLKKVLGRDPFNFEIPKHADIRAYQPADGDLIYIEIRGSDNKETLVNVEVEPKAGDAHQFTIFIHAHENTFKEPGKSAIEIWKQIENVMRSRGHLTTPTVSFECKKPRAMRDKTRHALQKLREIRLDAIRSNRAIPKKEVAMQDAQITKKTWREHARDLWAGWYDKDFRG